MLSPDEQQVQICLLKSNLEEIENSLIVQVISYFNYYLTYKQNNFESIFVCTLNQRHNQFNNA